MLFYESTRGGGGGHIVAVARVREAFLKRCDAIEVSDLQQSVLTTETLADIGKADMKCIAVFDNIFPLRNPVNLKTLQQLGCGRPNDLISSRPISDGQLRAILQLVHEGSSDA